MKASTNSHIAIMALIIFFRLAIGRADTLPSAQKGQARRIVNVESPAPKPTTLPPPTLRQEPASNSASPGSLPASSAELPQTGAVPSSPPQEDGFDSAQEQAGEHMKEARELFVSKQYEKSIAESVVAYKLAQWPICFYNIAQAYRRLQDRRQALKFYQRFLKDAPTSRFAADAQNAIIEISLYLQQQEQIDREKKRPVWRKGWFWGVLGTSLAVVGSGLATGLVLGLRSNQPPDMHGPVTVTFK